MRETERERQRGPYQCIAGGIRCNWGVCVSVCVCACVIEMTLVKLKTGKSSRQTDREKNRTITRVLIQDYTLQI